MTLTCPHCQSLVAGDPVSGVAPEHCPYCDGLIGAASEADQSRIDPSSIEIEVDVEAGVPAEHTADDPIAESVAPADETQSRAATDEAPGPKPPVGSTTLPAQPAAALTTRRTPAPPRFARRRSIDQLGNARWPWPVAVGLLLLLALQLIVADRATLAANARWRGAMIDVCRTLRCELPAWREAGAFTMLERDVRAHPGAANAMRVQASFRNDARWPQAWPELVLTLSDATGRVTGSRSFTPVEYLGVAPTQKLIATGQTANFVLDVVEPAPNTVSFSFDFR